MTQSLRIAFHTLGCKLNFSETSYIASELVKKGHFISVKFTGPADIYVINSCSVTHNAEKKCRELIRRVKKHNPQAIIAIIGCFSQLKSDTLFEKEKVDIVLGNQEKYKLFDYITKFKQTGQKQQHKKNTAIKNFVPAWSSESRTRTFFKIQDGCDYRCTYCIVPKARGRSRSDTINNTINKVKWISEKSIKELVLTGVNIGDFGKHHNETLLELLQELVKIETLKRIRLSSIEPNLLDDKIIELVANSSKIMPHFHIPLQSGVDTVLTEMKRNYDTKLFASKIRLIKELMPRACVAVDVIAGFPSETEENFSDTMRFIENLPISYLHVFTYSERENTPAAKYKNNIQPIDKKERSRKLKELSDKKLKNFYKMNMGAETNVLFENYASNGFISGFTPNYLRVKTHYSHSLVNSIKKVVLTDLDDDMKYMCNVL